MNEENIEKKIFAAHISNLFKWNYLILQTDYLKTQREQFFYKRET